MSPKNSWIKFVQAENLFFTLRYFIFPAFSLFLLYQILYKVETVIHGDGFEYALMTESLCNHLSPELTQEDLNTFKQNLVNTGKYSDWHRGAVDPLTIHLSDTNFLSRQCNYFTDLTGKKYSYHFWLYPLVNVPLRFTVDVFHINLEYIFPLTNLLVLVITCIFLLFKSSLSRVKLIFITLFFTFSSVYWYLPFSGPEVFVNCLCVISLVLYYEKKYYFSVLFASLASTHYPPLILIVAFVSIKALMVNGFNLKNIGYLFLSGFALLIPSLFYFYHFRIPNLIVYLGYVSESYFTFTRFFGVFFDLNQGMVLAIPVLIFVFFIIYVRNLFKGRRLWNHDLLLLPVVCGMISLFINMGYWNASYSILRYATWCCVPLIVFAIVNSDFSLKWIKYIFSIALLIHILNIYDVFNIYRMGGLQVTVWQGVKHNSVAQWVIETYPNLYNPDPDIFGKRYTGGAPFSSLSSPICHYNKDGRLCKAMVHISKVNELGPDKYNQKEIDNLNFINGWAYINY